MKLLFDQNVSFRILGKVKLAYLPTRLVLLPLLILVINLSSCCTEDFCSEIEGVKIINYDNTGKTPVVQDGDTIPAVAFMLEISFLVNGQYCEALKEFQFGISSANAISCDLNFLLKNDISNVSLYSNTDFNGSFPAGTELSELFQGPSYDRINREIEIDGNYEFNYYLLEKPDEEIARKFIVKTELVDGQTFSDTTTNVVLTID